MPVVRGEITSFVTRKAKSIIENDTADLTNSKLLTLRLGCDKDSARVVSTINF